MWLSRPDVVPGDHPAADLRKGSGPPAGRSPERRRSELPAQAGPEDEIMPHAAARQHGFVHSRVDRHEAAQHDRGPILNKGFLSRRRQHGRTGRWIGVRRREAHAALFQGFGQFSPAGAHLDERNGRRTASTPRKGTVPFLPILQAGCPKNRNRPRERPDKLGQGLDELAVQQEITAAVHAGLKPTAVALRIDDLCQLRLERREENCRGHLLSVWIEAQTRRDVWRPPARRSLDSQPFRATVPAAAKRNPTLIS
jgi:hypothetical protein